MAQRRTRRNRGWGDQTSPRSGAGSLNTSAAGPPKMRYCRLVMTEGTE